MAGVGTWAAYLIAAMKEIKVLGARVARLETLEPSIGLGHDHDGGDGALIPEAGLHADVIAQLVTNGDSHDHIGGDGASINTNALTNLAVTAGKLATAVQNKLVTGGDSHDHIGGDGAEIDTGALANKAVTQAKIDDLAVDTGQLAGEAVTSAKIAENAVGQYQIVENGVTGSELAASAVDSGEIAAGAIDTEHLANNVVDDTKAGNRVPQFYRRKGGSSSNWSTSGTSTYTPGAVRMQGGSHNVGVGGSASISFPASFGGAPIVIVTPVDVEDFATVGSVSSSSFTVYVRDYTGSPGPSVIYWLAIGPE